jgi:uncharacterized protein
MSNEKVSRTASGGAPGYLRLLVLVVTLGGALGVHFKLGVSFAASFLIFFVGWPLLGTLVTIDDDLPGGWSNPEAATVFADPFAVYLDDGSGEGRMVVIGTSLRQRALYVVHVERGDRDRIISARPATAAERAVYEGRGRT